MAYILSAEEPVPVVPGRAKIFQDGNKNEAVIHGFWTEAIVLEIVKSGMHSITPHGCTHAFDGIEGDVIDKARFFRYHGKALEVYSGKGS